MEVNKALDRKHPTRLKELRLARGFTQSQLAALTGYDFTAVCRHETGSRSLDAFAIERYCRVFRVTPAELFIDLDLWDEMQAAYFLRQERKTREEAQKDAERRAEKEEKRIAELRAKGVQQALDSGSLTPQERAERLLHAMQD